MDYPGRIASVVFTQGCNFKCPYCHNPELIAATKGSFDVNIILSHFRKNRLLLDGVVITGGEPTVQTGLPNFMRQIKELGLDIKLDTNGTNPQMLKILLREGLVDYSAIDIKSALFLSSYSLNSGINASDKILNNIKESINLVIESGIEHEFRTTVCKELISISDIDTIINNIEGSQQYYLQQYRPFDTDKEEKCTFSAYPINELENIIQRKKSNIKIGIRD